MNIKKRAEQNESDSQSMSAMSDVVFLLLVFFIVTMGAFAKTTLMDTSLPQPQAGSSDELPQSIMIEILPATNESNEDVQAATNQQNDLGENYVDYPKVEYKVNGIPHTRGQLSASLSRFAMLSPDMPVMVKCDPESLHGSYVNLLSTAQTSGLSNVSMLNSGGQ